MSLSMTGPNLLPLHPFLQPHPPNEGMMIMISHISRACKGGKERGEVKEKYGGM